ncbi:MAG: Hsp20/alpha crystallin family protein [Dehalococcoidia bacterium]
MSNVSDVVQHAPDSWHLDAGNQGTWNLGTRDQTPRPGAMGGHAVWGSATLARLDDFPVPRIPVPLIDRGVDRADGALHQPATSGVAISGAMHGLEHVPAADVAVSADRVVIVLDVPGTRDEQPHVALTGRTLEVSGTRPTPLHRAGSSIEQLETWSGPWRRTVELPAGTILDGAVVEHENGLLRIELKRHE